jgi:hypothetical protein
MVLFYHTFGRIKQRAPYIPIAKARGFTAVFGNHYAVENRVCRNSLKLILGNFYLSIDSGCYSRGQILGYSPRPLGEGLGVRERSTP